MAPKPCKTRCKYIQREIGGTIRKLKQFSMLVCAFFIILISLNVIGIISEATGKSHLVLTAILSSMFSYL